MQVWTWIEIVERFKFKLRLSVLFKNVFFKEGRRAIKTYTQFSTLRLFTHLKCFWLLLKRTAFKAKACAGTIISIAPISSHEGSDLKELEEGLVKPQPAVLLKAHPHIFLWLLPARNPSASPSRIAPMCQRPAQAAKRYRL